MKNGTLANFIEILRFTPGSRSDVKPSQTNCAKHKNVYKSNSNSLQAFKRVFHLQLLFNCDVCLLLLSRKHRITSKIDVKGPTLWKNSALAVFSSNNTCL